MTSRVIRLLSKMLSIIKIKTLTIIQIVNRSQSLLNENLLSLLLNENSLLNESLLLSLNKSSLLSIIYLLISLILLIIKRF